MGADQPIHWVILLVLAALLFGGYKKLPEMARSAGRSMRVFKTELKGLEDDDAARANAAGQGSEPTAFAQPAAYQPATYAQPTYAQPPAAPAQPAAAAVAPLAVAPVMPTNPAAVTGPAQSAADPARPTDPTAPPHA